MRHFCVTAVGPRGCQSIMHACMHACMHAVVHMHMHEPMHACICKTTKMGTCMQPSIEIFKSIPYMMDKGMHDSNKASFLASCPSCAHMSALAPEISAPFYGQLSQKDRNSSETEHGWSPAPINKRKEWNNKKKLAPATFTKKLR